MASYMSTFVKPSGPLSVVSFAVPEAPIEITPVTSSRDAIQHHALGVLYH